MSAYEVPRQRGGRWSASFARFTLIAGVLAATSAFASRTLDPLDQPSVPVALFAGVALVLFLWLTIVRLEWAVALAFLVFGFVRFEPAPTDLALLVIIAISLVTNRFELLRLPPSVFFLLGAFLFLNLVSAVEAVEPVRAAGYFGITLYLILFSVWVTAYVRSRRAARLVAGAYVWGAAIVSLPTLAGLLGDVPAGHVFLYDEFRGQGLFKDPNVWGPFLVPAILILIEDFFGARIVVRRRSLAVLLLTLLSVASVMAYSRASWANFAVGVAAMVAVFVLRRGGGGRAVTLLTALVVVITAVTTVMVVSGSIEFLRERAALQPYDAERFGGQAAGADVAAAHPFGVGPGQYEFFADYAAHSLYVRALAEHGVLGAVTLFALVTTTLALAFANAVRGRSTYGIGSAALLGAWAGIAVNSAFVDTLHWRHLWLFAGLVWAGSMRPLTSLEQTAEAGAR